MNQDNAFSLGNTSDDGADSIVIELEAHDASRFEWRVAIPSPAHQHLSYSVQAEFELPSTSILGPSPWNQLQGFTRLEEPQLPAERGDQNETVHLLRQQTLVLQQMLERARQGVLRHCRLVCEKPGEETAIESLVTWLHTAFRALAKARARAVARKADDSSQIVRERELADEFISVRLIEFVAEAEAMVEETLHVVAAVDVRFRPSLGVVDEHLVQALDAELTYRKAKGYLIPDADSTSSLEQFVERSGRLKKHFETALALDREAHPVDERLHIWLTCLAALIGGACAFAAQTYLMRWSSERTAGWSLAGLTMLMGATYAMRDRIKEVFHRWLAGHVYRLYAQRLVRCFMPDHLVQKKQAIVQAREWCHETTISRPDPLNPESGATLRVTVVNHVHRGLVTPQPQLLAASVHRIRQIFRYDLTPLCSRLHDPIKSIPVLDPGSGRARFVGAPRRYQMPIRVLAATVDDRRELKASLVLDKQGIVRIDYHENGLELGTGLCRLSA
ncbi:MAG TPA: hypothetical protein VFS35_00235 [Terrimicrobiaceae bacterium]|nr:hypothetical protein [Terrimicrobiaceae bacterium]